MTRRELEITDSAKILEILDEEKVVHLALCDGDQPYAIPMNYGYTMVDGVLTLYLHGALKGYKYDIIAENPKVSFSIEHNIQPFGGSVACQYGTAYSSLFGKGTMKVLENVDEKIHGLEVVMKSQTGKDFEINEKLVSIVNVMRVDVTEYTAKERPLPLSHRK